MPTQELCLSSAYIRAPYLLTTILVERLSRRKDRWPETILVWDMLWLFLLITFMYFMPQIFSLSCYLNIDTMLHIAYGGLWFQSTLEAVNSKENFNADVFVWNICINGWVFLDLSYWDFHKAFTALLLPVIFETDTSWK